MALWFKLNNVFIFLLNHEYFLRLKEVKGKHSNQIKFSVLEFYKIRYQHYYTCINKQL